MKVKELAGDVSIIVLTGYSNIEFGMQMNLKHIRPEPEIPKLERMINSIRSGKVGIGPKIFTHKKKNGEIITVEIKSSLIDHEGVKAEVVLANDITERMQYIKAIEDQNKRLQEIAWMSLERPWQDL